MHWHTCAHWLTLLPEDKRISLLKQISQMHKRWTIFPCRVVQSFHPLWHYYWCRDAVVFVFFSVPFLDSCICTQTRTRQSIDMEFHVQPAFIHSDWLFFCLLVCWSDCVDFCTRQCVPEHKPNRKQKKKKYERRGMGQHTINHIEQKLVLLH